MGKDQLQKIVAEKLDAAFQASEHPKKFFVTENGRGVVDGGDLYNAVLKDALGVVQVALVEILDATLNAKSQAPSQNEPKVSTGKSAAQSKDRKRN